MNKTELVLSVVEKTGFSKKDAAMAVDAVLDSVTDGMKKDGKVQLIGFGTFEAVSRAARKGRNPQTGDEMEIKACVQPKFKAGKALKDNLNS